MRKIDVARQLFVLTSILVGLASWNILPLVPSGRVSAAPGTRLATSPVQQFKGT